MSYRETLAAFVLAMIAIVATTALAGRLLFGLPAVEAFGWGVFLAAIQPWFLLFSSRTLRPRRSRGF